MDLSYSEEPTQRITFQFVINDAQYLNMQLIEQLGLEQGDYSHEVYLSCLEAMKNKPLSFVDAALRTGRIYRERVETHTAISNLLFDKEKAAEEEKRRREAGEDFFTRRMRQVRHFFENNPWRKATDECFEVMKPYLHAMTCATAGTLCESKPQDEALKPYEKILYSMYYRGMKEPGESGVRSDVGLTFRDRDKSVPKKYMSFFNVA